MPSGTDRAGRGFQGEPGEAQPDQADAPRYDCAVNERFEVVASLESLHQVGEDRTERGADQRRPLDRFRLHEDGVAGTIRIDQVTLRCHKPLVSEEACINQYLDHRVRRPVALVLREWVTRRDNDADLATDRKRIRRLREDVHGEVEERASIGRRKA
jgi:hypothetical protein